MATDAQTLIQESSCYQCDAPNLYTLMLINTSLIRQLVLAANPMAATDPQTLLNDARCLECYAPNVYTLMLMQTALLKQFVDGGGGGGGGADNILGSGSPVGVVTPDAEGQFYTDETNVPLPVLWQATGLTNVDWFQVT